jgi:hypothetical protein
MKCARRSARSRSGSSVADEGEEEPEEAAAVPDAEEAEEEAAAVGCCVGRSLERRAKEVERKDCGGGGGRLRIDLPGTGIVTADEEADAFVGVCGSAGEAGGAAIAGSASAAATTTAAAAAAG